ncbi:MAG: methylenetetrahydrofolate reductase [Vampirovibrio sp.]|nr:methylenetetrahydrofolate reductase [Vampirovibrio sp.]
MGFPEKLLTEDFLVTVEISPPKGTDVSGFLKRVNALKGKVDAINVPDCQRSILKMSSMAASKIIQDETGIDTVWQLTCRDRNLIALQADLMGASAMGLQTVLALTGDPVQVGDQKDVAKQVYHLESIRLLELLQSMNNGKDATGKDFKHQGTDFSVGAALNPLRMHNHAQKNRLQQKLERGVQFLQTQPVYDLEPVERMNETMSEVAEQSGVPVPRLLLGMIPPRSADAARFMNKFVSGIAIPQSFIDLLERSPDPIGESIQFCADRVHILKPHVNGFHFMPVGMESRSPALLDACFALT